MTIGLFINQFSDTEKAKDPGAIAAALVKLGHEVTLYTLSTTVADFSGVKVKAIKQSESRSAAFWAAEKPTVFLIYSWLSLRYSPLIKVLKSLDKKIILKLDSDGRLIYPFKPSYLRVFGLDSSLKSKFIHLLRLGQWFIFPKIISRKKIKQLISAEAVIIESPLASANLKKSLTYWQQENLHKKIFFIPNPASLSASPLSSSQPTEKENLIISVGRWHDKRKNAAGVIKALSALNKPDWRVLLIGRGAAELKDAIKKNNPSLEINSREFVPPAELSDLYRPAKIFFAPSLADSFNLAAAEALSCGLSLAATPLESFKYFAAGGRYGTTAEDPAQALTAEIANWENNLRDPQAVSAVWRQELSPEKIGREIDQLIKSLC